MALKLIPAVDGPSPNVNSGRPYANDPNTGPFTDSGEGTSGTGPGLGPNGIAATSLPTDETVQVVPSTIPVPQVDAETSGIRSGLASPGGIPTNTVMGVATAGTGKDQVQQNATTIPSEPNQG